MANEEQRISGACSCGRAVIKVLNSKVPTFRRSGIRYAYPEDIDTSRWDIFRCESCVKPIEDTFTPALSSRDPEAK